MSFQVVDIDHLMVRVAHFDASIEAFQRLGFTVTPIRQRIGDEPVAVATGRDPKGPSTINNCHILFKPYPGRDDVANFLELICIEDQLNTPPEVMRVMSFLLDSEGPKALMCLSEDLEASREAMRRQGIETLAFPLDTGWYDDKRSRFIPIWARPAVPVFGQTPFMVMPYETTALDGYHYEPWTIHPNTATYLAGVTGVTDDVEGHAALMADRVFGVEPAWEQDGVAVVRPRDIFLRMVSPRAFGQLFPGLDFSSERVLPTLIGATVAVGSIETLTRTLDANGVPYVETPAGGVAVARQLAANTLIEFVPHGEHSGS